MNYHASQLSYIRGKYSNQAPSNLSNSHRKFPLHNNLRNKRGSARIPSSSNLRSRIIAAILRSPYAIKHLDERATKPQNHETIFIYTRLTVPPLERDTEGERERETPFEHRFPCTWIPMGPRWRTAKGVKDRMGREKEKSTFFSHHNRIHGINRMENQVAPWFSRACSIILARGPRPRRARDDGDRAARDDGDYP